MGSVIMHAVVSLDGFVADDNDDVGPLFDWYFNGDRPLTDAAEAPFRVSATSAAYVAPFWAGIGATVMGRHLFDLTNGWEAKPPAGDHLLVVSHRPKPEGWHPEADVPFFDDVVPAIEEARRRAGDRVVAVTAGEMGGRALAAGLVDEVAMDVVPVVFGSGKRYFGSMDGQVLLEDPHVVIQGDRVLHLRYRVRGR
ncbi:MAG TPA: dihydrofolate reductase family protein [Nocardioides sp.]|nr:dihydrofolate reductase family protein [Nocardioides sp.]